MFEQSSQLKEISAPFEPYSRSAGREEGKVCVCMCVCVCVCERERERERENINNETINA